MKKYKIFLFVIILFFGANQTIYSQKNKNRPEDFSRSIKLRTTFGDEYWQFYINPNYCVISKQHEYSFGVFYRDRQYRYLVFFKRVISPMKSYGIRLGYINNVKNSNRIKLRFETNVTLALTTAHAIISNEHKRLNNVYSAEMEFGPNLKIPICKNVDFGILLQIGYSYGVNGSSKYLFQYQYPSGGRLGLAYFFDINYKF